MDNPKMSMGVFAHPPDYNAEKYCYGYEYKSGEINREVGD